MFHNLREKEKRPVEKRKEGRKNCAKTGKKKKRQNQSSG